MCGCQGLLSSQGWKKCRDLLTHITEPKKHMMLPQGSKGQCTGFSAWMILWNHPHHHTASVSALAAAVPADLRIRLTVHLPGSIMSTVISVWRRRASWFVWNFFLFFLSSLGQWVPMRFKWPAHPPTAYTAWCRHLQVSSPCSTVSPMAIYSPTGHCTIPKPNCLAPHSSILHQPLRAICHLVPWPNLPQFLPGVYQYQRSRADLSGILNVHWADSCRAQQAQAIVWWEKHWLSNIGGGWGMQWCCFRKGLFGGSQKGPSHWRATIAVLQS